MCTPHRVFLGLGQASGPTAGLQDLLETLRVPSSQSTAHLILDGLWWF